jgi:hypothetical protein
VPLTSGIFFCARIVPKMARPFEGYTFITAIHRQKKLPRDWPKMGDHMTYEEIIQRRRNFNIPVTGDKYKTLAEIDFDGPWITPYQVSSYSPTGPVLIAYHWFDVPSVNEHRQILKEKGYAGYNLQQRA